MGAFISVSELRNFDRVTSLFTIIMKLFFLLMVCASCTSAKVMTEHVEVDIHKVSEDTLSELAKIKGFTNLVRSRLQENHESHVTRLDHFPVDQWKTISLDIGRFANLMEVGIAQMMAKKNHESHVTRLNHFPVYEGGVTSHGIQRFALLIKAGIERMLVNRHEGDHLRLSEVVRPIGQYIHKVVDANGDGIVTRAEVNRAAASLNHDASVIITAASVILKELRPTVNALDIIRSRFANSPHDDGKGTSHGIQRVTHPAKTGFRQRMAQDHDEKHVTKLAHSPVDEWKAISLGIRQLVDKANAGLMRMMDNRNQGHHLRLYEVFRPIGHYLVEKVDANGDGMVTREEVSHAAASFDHAASEVGKVVSTILRVLRPMLTMYNYI